MSYLVREGGGGVGELAHLCLLFLFLQNLREVIFQEGVVVPVHLQLHKGGRKSVSLLITWMTILYTDFI